MGFAYGIFCITFGIVAMILNLAVAWAIRRDKSMRSATYNFMIFLALCDVEAIFGIIFAPAFLMVFDLGNAANIYFKVCAFCNGGGFRTSVCMMVLVSISRWGFFSKNNFTAKLFAERNRNIICVSILIFVHLLYSPFIWYPGAVTRLSDDTGAYAYTNVSVSRFINYFDDSTNCLGVLIQIVFNTMSFGCVFKMRKSVLTAELRAINMKEIKLLIQCGIDSLVFTIIIMLFDFSFYTGYNETWFSVITEIFYILNHVDCALLYLCFNKKLRAFLINTVKTKMLGAGTTTAVVVVKIP